MPDLEYMFAPPRLEHVNVPEPQYKKQAGASSLLPNSLYEILCVVLSTGTASTLNLRLGARKVPMYRGIWKYPIAYALGLAFARWGDKASWATTVQEDKIIVEYMKLHPEKFPVYKPKLMRETFAPWRPLRSGGGVIKMREDDEQKFMKREETEHYMPISNEKF